MLGLVEGEETRSTTYGIQEKEGIHLLTFKIDFRSQLFY